MPKRPKRRSKLEAELERLHALDLAAPCAPKALADVLDRGHAQSVVIAAHLGAKHELDLADALERAFDRMMDRPIERDPGCYAKVAVLEALLSAGGMRYTPFRAAVVHVQREPGWPEPTDTATGVRSLGLLGLVATLHPEAMLFAGELLADVEVPVRLAAVEAVARMGQPAGAALLLMRLRLGDEDPAVLDAAARALLSLAEERAIEALEAMLAHADVERQEVAAMALGDAKSPRAVAALVRHARSIVLPSDRALFVRALGSSRLDEARDYLFELLASEIITDARAALDALAVHRYDDALVARVRAAVRESDHDLSDAFLQAFGPKTDGFERD